MTESAWHQHRTAVYRYLIRHLPGADLAEDLLQETFLRFHRTQPAPHEAQTIRAWLLHTAHNLVVDHYRSTRVWVALDDNQGGEAPATISPLHTLESCIAPLTAQLPVKYREALVMELDGVPQQEIALRCGISLSGAKSRVQRARRLLRDEFDRCCRFEFAGDGSLLDYRQREAAHPCR